jgi:pimeloyl-ACP methyl ester carboxylesterase
MPFYEKGSTKIHYREVGTGFPMLILPGGGLNATTAFCTTTSPFDPMEEFRGSYRCIIADSRHANRGYSSGPLEVDRPWDAYTDDQLGLMDHLGIDKFLVMGFCIGGPYIWNLLKRAPGRVVAAIHAQPSAYRPEMPDLFRSGNMKEWAPTLCLQRPQITMEMVHQFLTNMYTNRSDFVFTVDRDFVRQCKTPTLVLPDDSVHHPYAVAKEVADLCPGAEISIYPWKQPTSLVPQAVARIREFLAKHAPK